MHNLSVRAIHGFIRFVTIPIIAVLLIFNARRLLFSLAILFPQRTVKSRQTTLEGEHFLPDILILAPCHDEEKMIPGLCQALYRLDYPGERYQVVLIDDGSTDRTKLCMEHWIQGKIGWHVLSLPENVGKASALNSALRECPFGEIVYIFDADHRPYPDSLRRAVRHFTDPLVAGVSGLTTPSNPLASPSAYYSTVENHIHRLITMRAKDRIQLAPALLGSNCGYRRTALTECDGFRESEFLEDSDLTLAFYRKGYRVRFAEDAVAKHQVPETIRGYLKQHARWSRGFMDVAKQHSVGLLWEQKLSLPLRIELFLFSAGYLDRIATAGAGALTLLSFLDKKNFQFPRQIFTLALFVPLAQILILFIEQRMPAAMWFRLPFIPIFYSIDIIAAGKGVTESLTRRAKKWTKTKRSQGADDGY